MKRKEFLRNATLATGAIALMSTTSCDETSKPKRKAKVKSKIDLSSIALPVKVAEIFASRSHRLHHAIWHGLRDFWENDKKVSTNVQRAIINLKWAPPRPALKWTRDGWLPKTMNGSGIDFLFMHREMLKEFDDAMKKEGANADIGWKLIPEPGLPEKTHPGIGVPPTWNLPPELKWLERRFAAVKSDEFYWSRMRWWDRQFHDHSYLKTITLGQLGSQLETSVHNDMHMRWASEPFDPETGKPTVMGRPENDRSKKWDDPAYNFIGETYSSQVHPIFWRLHKWVDSIIDEWYIAHETNNKGSVKPKTIDGINWFEKGLWVEVDDPWSAPSKHAHHDIPTMEKVFDLLFPKNSKGSDQGVMVAEDQIPTKIKEPISNEKPMSWF